MTTAPVIHVGVDASWRETGVLEWALQESLLRQEPLQVVHVIDERRTRYWEPIVADEAATDLIKDVQQYLDDSSDHTVDLAVGRPARTLIDLAANGRMLVVGRRGIGTFRRLLIGSTSEAVATGAGVPVVVVPHAWKPGDHAGPVVVGVEDSDDNQAAIEFAAEVAIERKVALHLVTVWDLPAMYSWDAVNAAGLTDQWTEAAERHLDALADEWRQKHPELTIRVEVRRGHAVDGLVSAAHDTDAQLLVVGGRRHHRTTAALLGSVARGVLHHTTSPVAIVHENGR